MHGRCLGRGRRGSLRRRRRRRAGRNRSQLRTHGLRSSDGADAILRRRSLELSAPKVLRLGNLRRSLAASQVHISHRRSALAGRRHLLRESYGTATGRRHRPMALSSLLERGSGRCLALSTTAVADGGIRRGIGAVIVVEWREAEGEGHRGEACCVSTMMLLLLLSSSSLPSRQR